MMRALLRRYGTLLATQARVSTALALQYRLEFVLKSLMALAWLAITLVPIAVVFQQRPSLIGWSFPEALVVMGWFVLLRGILEGGVTPSLTTVVEGIRTGMFDFLLLKPADAQFLVSTARFEPWRIADLAGAVAIFCYAFSRLGRWPSAGALAMGFALLLSSVVLLYSLWILIVSLSLRVVKVENLGYLLASIFDAARWPVSVFPLGLRLVFTVVFPLALMTTYPALALLDRLTPVTLLTCLLGSATFSTLSRLVWLRSLRAYTSASS